MFSSKPGRVFDFNNPRLDDSVGVELVDMRTLNPTERTGLFSLAITLYELLTFQQLHIANKNHFPEAFLDHFEEMVKNLPIMSAEQAAFIHFIELCLQDEGQDPNTVVDMLGKSPWITGSYATRSNQLGFGPSMPNLIDPNSLTSSALESSTSFTSAFPPISNEQLDRVVSEILNDDGSLSGMTWSSNQQVQHGVDETSSVVSSTKSIGKVQRATKSTANQIMGILPTTIRGAVDEWYNGINGHPSIASMDGRFGKSWRVSNAMRNRYIRRKFVIDRIEVLKQCGMTMNQAIQFAEQEKRGRSMSDYVLSLRNDNFKKCPTFN